MTRRPAKTAAAPAVSPPDLNGDGEPGGSISQLAWSIARTGRAACHAWGLIHGLEEPVAWQDLTPADRLLWGIEADRCINDPAYVPTFAPIDDRWEAQVRGKMFAVLVGSIAR